MRADGPHLPSPHPSLLMPRCAWRYFITTAAAGTDHAAHSAALPMRGKRLAAATPPKAAWGTLASPPRGPGGREVFLRSKKPSVSLDGGELPDAPQYHQLRHRWVTGAH